MERKIGNVDYRIKPEVYLACGDLTSVVEGVAVLVDDDGEFVEFGAPRGDR